MGVTDRFQRRGLRRWARQLRRLDGYERLPRGEHLIAADLAITNVFGVGTECRVFLSKRAVYLLSAVPRAKGTPRIGTDMMATRIPFDSVRTVKISPGNHLFVAYDSPHGAEGRRLDFSRWGLSESFVDALSEHVLLER
jgi:hypothetical protein